MIIIRLARVKFSFREQDRTRIFTNNFFMIFNNGNKIVLVLKFDRQIL